MVKAKEAKAIIARKKLLDYSFVNSKGREMINGVLRNLEYSIYLQGKTSPCACLISSVIIFVCKDLTIIWASFFKLNFNLDVQYRKEISVKTANNGSSCIWRGWD